MRALGACSQRRRRQFAIAASTVSRIMITRLAVSACLQLSNFNLNFNLPVASLPPPCSCVLMCHAPKKEYYKKFLFEPLPGGLPAPAVA